MAPLTQLLSGQRGIVVGVANARSLAWGIAAAAHRHGAELAITHQSPRFAARTAELAASVGAWTAPLDVTDDAQVSELAAAAQNHWGTVDFVVHAVASAQREDLKGAFVGTSRVGFALAHDVSVYSLVALARALGPLMRRPGGGAFLALTYLGAERTVPHYNVMGVAKAGLQAAVRYLAHDLGPQGVRVNALSAGPVKTLSAAGVRGMANMLSHVAAHAPLRRNVSLEEVGDAAVCLLSPLMRATTGEVVHVDGGYHSMGAPAHLDGGVAPPASDASSSGASS